MKYFFEISIIVFTSIITILPFTGELWRKKKRKFKFYKRGIAFLVFSFLGLLFAIIHIIRETQEQDERDTTQNKTFDNTKIIMTRIDSSAMNLESKLIRIDSLNIKLDSLNHKTISSINNRNNILENFNLLNEKLGKIYAQETLKISENIPQINILDAVEWKIDENVYKISLQFTNTGGRMATNFNLKVTFFKVNQDNKIISYHDISKDLLGESEIPVDKKLMFRIPIIREKSDDNGIHRGFIVVHFKYVDFIDEREFIKEERFIWRSVEQDSLQWRSMPKSISKKLDNFIKVKGIKISI